MAISKQPTHRGQNQALSLRDLNVHPSGKPREAPADVLAESDSHIHPQGLPRQEAPARPGAAARGGHGFQKRPALLRGRTGPRWREKPGGAPSGADPRPRKLKDQLVASAREAAPGQEGASRKRARLCASATAGRGRGSRAPWRPWPAARGRLGGRLAGSRRWHGLHSCSQGLAQRPSVEFRVLNPPCLSTKPECCRGRRRFHDLLRGARWFWEPLDTTSQGTWQRRRATRPLSGQLQQSLHVGVPTKMTSI